MERCVSFLVDYFVSNGLLEEQGIPWVRYGLTRRLVTLVGAFPFFILAVILTGFWESLAFFGSFYALRSWCNGYHAKSFLACLVLSLVIEVAFLCGLRYLLTPVFSVILNVISTVLLLRLAPFNHPSMHYTKEEITAIKGKIRVSMIILGGLLCVFYILKMWNMVYGLTNGIAMTAFLLCLAYITKRRKTYELHQQQNP